MKTLLTVKELPTMSHLLTLAPADIVLVNDGHAGVHSIPYRLFRHSVIVATPVNRGSKPPPQNQRKNPLSQPKATIIQ